jgi:glucose-1-phosphate thymidylyltransferase
VNRAYLDRDQLFVEKLARGIAWLDTGTHDSLMQASNYIHAIEERQGLMVACLEEIAYRMGWISGADVRRLASAMASSTYGQYLIHMLETEG